MITRLWKYQKERFPLLGHGLPILAFSFSAVSFSSLLRTEADPPEATQILFAFVCAICFFLQLRVADEFKDFEEDRQYRSYRPVPRGLITLQELAIVAIIAGGIQFLIVWILQPFLSGLLCLTWLYMGLMSKEFFMRDFLRAHPLVYMSSHMVSVPLIAFFLSAFDWGIVEVSPSKELVWFLVISFFNGSVIEIGRKIRAPETEEQGVETYSALWGTKKAVVAWIGTLVLSGTAFIMAAAQVYQLMLVGVVLAGLFVVGQFIGGLFLLKPVPGTAKCVEVVSGLWIMALYAILGLGHWLIEV